MDIQILPYIDHENLKAKAAKTSAAGTAPAADTKDQSDFQTAFTLARQTMDALTVDLLTKEDAQTIQKAADILQNSRIAQLRRLGVSLAGVSQSDAAAKSSTSEVTSATASTALTGEAVDTTSAGTTSSASIREAAKKAADVLGCPDELIAYFEEAADTYDVDVALLMAIAKAESDFKQSSTSSAGAIGVMQLMPETAADLGISDPYDTHDNILGGAKEISGYLEKYDGDLSLSLAAYNAGAGNVKKYGGVPPFKETQNYIPKVTNYYNSAKEDSAS